MGRYVAGLVMPAPAADWIRREIIIASSCSGVSVDPVRLRARILWATVEHHEAIARTSVAYRLPPLCLSSQVRVWSLPSTYTFEPLRRFRAISACCATRRP